LGGELNLEKLKFLLFSKMFFNKVFLIGKIGYLFSLYKYDSENKNL